MTRLLFLILSLAICLSACGARTDESPKSAIAKARKCPDPDNRDSRDPCSVAYIQRTPSRVSEDALK